MQTIFAATLTLICIFAPILAVSLHLSSLPWRFVGCRTNPNPIPSSIQIGCTYVCTVLIDQSQHVPPLSRYSSSLSFCLCGSSLKGSLLAPLLSLFFVVAICTFLPLINCMWLLSLLLSSLLLPLALLLSLDSMWVLIKRIPPALLLPLFNNNNRASSSLFHLYVVLLSLSSFYRCKII